MELGGTTTPGRRAGAATPPGPADTADIARAIFELSKPDLLAAREDLVVSLKQAIEKMLEETIAATLAEDGPVAELVRFICKEEIDAFGERQPKPEDIAASVSKAVGAAVIHVIKTTPQARSVHQMSKDELCAAASKAVSGFKKFREHLPDILTRRITAIAANDDATDDVLTIFFPPASKKIQTYSHVEFEKIVMSLLNTIYKQNWLKAKEERPFIMRMKQQLDVSSLDVLDVTLLALGRTALHEGRSEARKLFFKNFAVYFMVPGASMTLQDAEAIQPVMGAGANSAYFAVVQKIRASETGDVTLEPTPSVQIVSRQECLYNVAGLILQGMALHPHVFAPEVNHAVACNLRAILLSTEPVGADGSPSETLWTTEQHKDAEKRMGPGVWSLLLPMTDRRPALKRAVQTLTPSEKQDVRISEQVGATAGTAASAVDSAEPSQPSWL